MHKQSWQKALIASFSLLFILAIAQTATLTKTVMPAYFGQPPVYFQGSGQAAPVLDGQDYVADVTQGGWFTWPQNRLPIRVFIEDGTGTPGYQSHFQSLVRNAFDEWQRISGGKLSWIEVSSPRQANVICSWTAQVNASGNKFEAGETQTTIERNPFNGTGNIMNAHVYVLTSLFGQSLNERDTYKTCLHEVGHALGMQGHSHTPGDIMYPTLNPYQVPYLTQRDANTITELYAQSSDANSIAQSPSAGYNWSTNRPSMNPNIRMWADHVRRRFIQQQGIPY